MLFAKTEEGLYFLKGVKLAIYNPKSKDKRSQVLQAGLIEKRKHVKISRRIPADFL